MMLEFFKLWAFFGFFFIMVMPVMSTRRKEGIVMFLGGPLVWLIFAWYALPLIRLRMQERKLREY